MRTIGPVAELLLVLHGRAAGVERLAFDGNRGAVELAVRLLRAAIFGRLFERDVARVADDFEAIDLDERSALFHRESRPPIELHARLRARCALERDPFRRCAALVETHAVAERINAVHHEHRVTRLRRDDAFFDRGKSGRLGAAIGFVRAGRGDIKTRRG